MQGGLESPRSTAGSSRCSCERFRKGGKTILTAAGCSIRVKGKKKHEENDQKRNHATNTIETPNIEALYDIFALTNVGHGVCVCVFRGVEQFLFAVCLLGFIL